MWGMNVGTPYIIQVDVIMAVTVQQGTGIPNGKYNILIGMTKFIKKCGGMLIGKAASPAQQGPGPTRGTQPLHALHAERVQQDKNV
jgi:hypothetical protein